MHGEKSESITDLHCKQLLQTGPSLGILYPVHRIFYGAPSKSRSGGVGMEGDIVKCK